MMGKRTGSTKGKGGSMHYYNKKTNFYGGHGIVGAQLPMGTGLAFALKYSGKPNVAVAMYGDGGSNQGQFFEASNMAYLWKLPVIYICENNLYSMGTPLALHAMNTNLYERGDQIPGLLVDAQNYFNVKAIMQWAKDYSV
jgi:pyruvate dehydrogenase E1 component alpha subunit